MTKILTPDGSMEVLAKELSDGWRFTTDRDPDDPRFAVVTIRMPYEPGAEMPTPEVGIAAQIATVGFSLSTCVAQGIVPRHIAERVARELDQAAAQVAESESRPRIITDVS
jgi:hypothetical protein